MSRTAQRRTTAGHATSYEPGHRDRAGRLVNVQCKLMRTDSDERAGYAGGAASLNESEWGMLGHSVALSTSDYRPEPPVKGQAQAPVEQKVIQRMDEKAQGEHPLKDPNFLFPIRIMIGGQERKGVFRGNDYFVPVRKGEVFEIWVENRSGQRVLMRLLADGLNTLPEKEMTKGVQSYMVGKRVNLDEARHWELDPADATLYAIRGFFAKVGNEGQLREFLVTDAGDSLAARQKFTDQVGLITAAFYTPVPVQSEPQSHSRGGLGVKLGKQQKVSVGKAGDFKPGNLLSVVNIRYVDAAALENQQN